MTKMTEPGMKIGLVARLLGKSNSGWALGGGLAAIGRDWIARLRDDRGSALVEFAVVLPVMISILTGTASFSMFLYNYQQLGYTVSTASQQVASQQGLLANGDPCATAVTSVTGALPRWTAGNFTYTVVITDSNLTTHTYGPTTGSSFSCTAGYSLMADNQPFALTVTYRYTWLPILSFSPSGNLSASQTSITE